MNDKINPSHYDGDACMLKIANVTRGLSGASAFCIGQAIKYLWRAVRKSGEALDDDVRKAIWYLDWLEAHGFVDAVEEMRKIRGIIAYTAPEILGMRMQTL